MAYSTTNKALGQASLNVISWLLMQTMLSLGLEGMLAQAVMWLLQIKSVVARTFLNYDLEFPEEQGVPKVVTMMDYCQ
jgi:hypothetical protein